jgi:hypothetical protein
MDSNVNIKSYFRKEMVGVADYGTEQGRRGDEADYVSCTWENAIEFEFHRYISSERGFEIPRKIDFREDVNGLVQHVAQQTEAAISKQVFSSLCLKQ